MNTTRLMLDYNDLFIPISTNCVKLTNNQCNTFLVYFGLPNSPITVINDDEVLSTTSDSEIEPASNQTVVYDTIDNSSNEIVYETFFSQLSHKFSVFDSMTFEEIQSELFLDTCEDYLLLVGKFNSPIFIPLKADINGNINKLRRKINQNVMKFQTLYAIVNDEIEARTTNARNSATDALLWLKRAFEFLSCFLHEFGMGDKSLLDAVSKAYEQSLRNYHGLLARSLFFVALRAAPDNAEFLRSLAVDPDDASEALFTHQVFKEMLDHSSSVSSVLNKITLFYSKHGLESKTVIT